MIIYHHMHHAKETDVDKTVLPNISLTGSRLNSARTASGSRRLPLDIIAHNVRCILMSSENGFGLNHTKGVMESACLHLSLVKL